MCCVLHRKDGDRRAVTLPQKRSNTFQFGENWKGLERLLMTERQLGLAFFDGGISTFDGGISTF